MQLKRTFATLLLLAFVFTISLSIGFLVGCGENDPVSSSCTDCGSGDVSWDSNVERRRDNDTGQFVKSCCCGH